MHIGNLGHLTLLITVSTFVAISLVTSRSLINGPVATTALFPRQRWRLSLQIRPDLIEIITRSSLHMTKKEIVKSISEELGLTQLKTKEIVQRTFDAIIDTLATDGRIELRNFGVFEVKKRAARVARNPRTGDQVEVPEKFVVTFKPGKEMEARVAQLSSRNTAIASLDQAGLEQPEFPIGEPHRSPLTPGNHKHGGPP